MCQGPEPRASHGPPGRVQWPGRVGCARERPSQCPSLRTLTALSHHSALAVLTSPVHSSSHNVTPGAREPRALHGGLLRHRRRVQRLPVPQQQQHPQQQQQQQHRFRGQEQQQQQQQVRDHRGWSAQSDPASVSSASPGVSARIPSQVARQAAQHHRHRQGPLRQRVRHLRPQRRAEKETVVVEIRVTTRMRIWQQQLSTS